MEAMMTDVQRSISFGLKTSQPGFAYDEILTLWLEADRMPIFEHAWLWDHMLPLRGDVATGDPGVVDFARRPGRADHTPAPRCNRDQQPFAATDAAGQDGRHRRL